MTPPDIHQFLGTVMNIKVLRMGGASAGILGTSGADTDTLNNLKKSAVTFAKEYSKPQPDPDVLAKQSQEIDGFLQTLQVMNTISKDEADKLIAQLQLLLEKKADG